jgi:hypothetical protein
LSLSGSVSLVRPADDHNPPARQLFIADFPRKLQVEPQTPGFPASRIVEKVNHISSKSISQTTPFIQIEGAGRIHFQIARITQGSAQLALKSESSLPHLRHRKSHNVVGHKPEPGSRMADDAEAVQQGALRGLAGGEFVEGISAEKKSRKFSCSLNRG